MTATHRSKVLLTAGTAATAVGLSAALSAPALAAAHGTAGLGAAVAAPAAAAGAPVLAFTPSPHDYGPVTAGQTASQAFTLANSGGKVGRALTVRLSGSAAFTITTDTCAGTSLEPGKSCTVTVRFAPNSPGTVTAALTAASHKTVLATDALTGTDATAGHLYWTDPGAGTVMTANLDGSSPQTLASGQSAFGVAVGPR